MKTPFAIICMHIAVCGYAANDAVISIKPTILSPEGGPRAIPGARIEAISPPEWQIDLPGFFGYAGYALKSTLTTKPEFNDEPTVIDAKAGFKWRLDNTRPPDQVFRPGGLADGRISERAEQAFRLGSVSAEFAFAFEGDEPMRNRQWAYGCKVIYTPSFERSERQWWMPYLWIDYRRIDELGSTVAEKIGVPRQNYWRLGAMIHWQVALSQWVSDGQFLRHLKVVPGMQYHRSTDRELGLLGGDLGDAYAYSLALDYTVPQSATGWLGRIRGIRFQVVDGRVPPATENRTTFSIAIDVNWGSLLK